jgi:hypothetical protein
MARLTAVLVGWDTSVDRQNDGLLFRGNRHEGKLITLVRLLRTVIRRLGAPIVGAAAGLDKPLCDYLETIRIVLGSLPVVVQVRCDAHAIDCCE